MSVTLPRRSLTPANQLFEACVQLLQSWVETPLAIWVPLGASAVSKSQVFPPSFDSFR